LRSFGIASFAFFNVKVKIENDVLSVEGRIDFSKCDAMEWLYIEYNVGHFARAFTLSGKDEFFLFLHGKLL
jgi:HSP20 family molecular chaperone IbpA